MIRFLLLLAALCLATILLEGIPVLFVRDRNAWWRASVICNIVTNPTLNLLVFLLTAYIPDIGIMTVIVPALELIVVLTEAWIYRKMLSSSVPVCFLFSLIANALSWGIGTVLMQY